MNNKETVSFPIFSFVFICFSIGFIIFLFSSCCEYNKKHYEEYKKAQFEKYMEGYKSRMAGNNGINWK